VATHSANQGEQIGLFLPPAASNETRLIPRHLDLPNLQLRQDIIRAGTTIQQPPASVTIIHLTEQLNKQWTRNRLNHSAAAVATELNEIRPRSRLF